MPNILIVDDREDIRKSYKRELDDAHLGWIILTAKDEKEAEKIIMESCPDVIITDLIMLTEESGINVLRLAKQKDPLAMVIIVTAFEAKLDRFQAFELGAFDCIPRVVPNVKTAQEIIIKTKTALRFKELTILQIENQKKFFF